MNKATVKRVTTNHFRVDGQDIKFVPVADGGLEWNRLGHETVLLEIEVQKAKAMGYDQKKVLKVKSCLVLGMSKMAIHKETKISRSAIDNYIKVLS